MREYNARLLRAFIINLPVCEWYVRGGFMSHIYTGETPDTEAPLEIVVNSETVHDCVVDTVQELYRTVSTLTSCNLVCSNGTSEVGPTTWYSITTPSGKYLARVGVVVRDVASTEWVATATAIPDYFVGMFPLQTLEQMIAEDTVKGIRERCCVCQG